MPDDASLLQPLYRSEACQFIGPLRWVVTVFWKVLPGDEAWVDPLRVDLKADSIRLLNHRFHGDCCSQFFVSTRADRTPKQLVQRVKGRLQYCIREHYPKALKRNYAIRSVGGTRRRRIESYVANQLGHHQMADARVQKLLRALQWSDPLVRLEEGQRSSHGQYWVNYHVVLVHKEREHEVEGAVLRTVRDGIIAICRQKQWRLRSVGLLSDHVHLVLGCGMGDEPREVVLGLLNNLSYLRGMRAVYQAGGYVGTFGEYDQRVIGRE